jgi:eukaryotic-like serine/threonine-protein kinase
MNESNQREKSIFEAALQLPATERATYLDTACGSDTALRRRVEALLRASENAGEFLEAPPTGLTAGDESTLVVSQLSEKPGDKIGRYKLLQQIGEGGCGVVYMAEQQEPVRRRVALKVIKLGMDTKSVIARFEAERQALALMDHPNIAKVLDAGATETGRPYFVMELVRGIKITDYCDQNNLSTEERLKLFTQVCHAIQHAHQKGIIHRDIKPSNILVTISEPGSPGTPKVIDFGIAKATTDQPLTDKTVFTAFEQFIGTPAYMSPEQAMMTSLDIDTRTDIYALGVLLYELLTGQTPFDAKDLMAAGLDAMRRTIREQEPARPSTRLSTMLEADLTIVAHHRHSEPAKLGTLLRGDLDWIVMKALEKDRTRRYETANGLAADIQRHLTNEPVVARPPSRLYRLQKLARRNKLAFGAIAAVATALVLGVVASSWQAVRATRAEQAQIKLREEADAGKKKAQSEAARSEQVAQFMKDMLKGVGPGVARGRDTALLAEILDQTAGRLSKDLANQPEVEADLRDTLGFIYRDLGSYSNAAAMHQDALTIRKKLYGTNHPAVASSLTGLGQVLHRQGEYDAAEAVYREALAMQKRIHGAEHADVASTLAILGSVVRKKGNLTEAEPLLREALAIRKKVFGNEHADVADSLSNLGLVLRAQREKLAEAEQAFREAVAIRRKLLGNDHFSVATTLSELGRVLEMENQPSEAEVLCREAVAIGAKVFNSDHPGQEALLDAYIRVLRRLHKYSEAEVLQRRMLALQIKLLGDDHAELVISVRVLAEDLRTQKKWEEAEIVFKDLLARQRRLGTGSVDTTRSALADVLVNQGKLAEAETVLLELLTSQRQSQDRKRPDLTPALIALARVQDRQNKLPEAERSYAEALELRRKQLGRDHKSVAELDMELALLLVKNGKFPEADAAFGEAVSVGKKLLNTNDPSVISWLENFTATLHKSGKSQEAEKHFEKLIEDTRKTRGDSDPAFARMLHSFGDLLLYSENKPAVAVEQYLKALTIHRASEDGHLLWTLRNLAIALRQLGKPKDAELYLREGLAVSLKIGRRSSWSLEPLAAMLSDQGKLAEAEAAIREALAFQRKSLGDEHLEVAEILGCLSVFLRDQGKLPEAVSTAREALAIRKKLRGNEHVDVGHALHVLAWNLNAQGKRAEAEALSREELALRKKLLGNGHPDVIAIFHALIVQLRDQGKAVEAETTLREAVAECRAALAKYKGLASDRNRHHDCWSFANGYEAFGHFLQESGQTQEAEKVYRDTQVLWRKLVADSPNSEDYRFHLAVNYEQIGNLLNQAGRPIESLQVYRDAQAIWVKLVAEFNQEDRRNHLGWTDDIIGRMLNEAGRFDEAAETYRRARVVWEKLAADFNKDPHLNLLAGTLVSLARTLEAAGKRTESEQAFREALAMRRKLLPVEEPQTAAVLAELTRTLLIQQKFSEAEPLARECLTLREKNLPNDWLMFNSRSLLGGSLLGQKKFAEAEPLLLSSYEGMKQREANIPAIGKPRVKETIQRLVQLYEATGQSDKVAEWKKQLAEFDQAQATKQAVAPKPQQKLHERRPDEAQTLK